MLTNSLVYEWSDANLFERPAFDIFSANLGYVLPVEGNRSLRADINVYREAGALGGCHQRLHAR